MEEKKVIKISEPVISEVIGVLSQLPYGQVFQLINKIQSDLQVNNSEKTDTKDAIQTES